VLPDERRGCANRWLTNTAILPDQQPACSIGAICIKGFHKTRPMRPHTDPPASHGRYASFREFYPFYLAEHRDRTCRRLHVLGTALALAVIVAAALVRNPWLLLLAPPAGYGFAWVGHFVFERNRPATFKHPLYSLVGDFALFRDILIGRIRF